MVLSHFLETFGTLQRDLGSRSSNLFQIRCQWTLAKADLIEATKSINNSSKNLQMWYLILKSIVKNEGLRIELSNAQFKSWSYIQTPDANITHLFDFQKSTKQIRNSSSWSFWGEVFFENSEGTVDGSFWTYTSETWRQLHVL